MRNVRILVGDCVERLRELPEKSVHCCVTSPPYFGLRDYGTATWEGGDPSCDHKPSSTLNERGILSSTLGGGKNHTGHKQEGFKSECPRCGACRVDNQIGLESTPEEYVAKMVDVFREVRRVLRDDGTMWLNLGDSYAAQRGGTHQPAETLAGGKGGRTQDGDRVNRDRIDGYNPTRNAAAIGLKHKDLIGIPWRVAFALQADGWYLRQDIIWHKPNPMPESVTDRCTKAHEYVFLLAKSERYFCDAEAIKEDSVTGNNCSSFTSKYDRETKRGLGLGERQETVHRNRRSVWTISTKPYRGAHFATMPIDLAEDCIKAGTSEHGCCAECGAPFHRVTEKRQLKRERPNQYVKRNGEAGTGNSCANDVAGVECVTVGWRPACTCAWSEPVPCTVLDPFGGAGTTALAAARLGRQAVICELNPKYAQMAKERIRDDSPMLNEVETT